MYGSKGATDGPLPTLETYTGLTYHNSGESGTCIATGYSNISIWLTIYAPSRVYCNYGINDIRTWADTCHSPMETWLAYYAAIKSACTSAGATLYAMQITPDCGCTIDFGNDPSGTIKLWNAYLEDWCFTNGIPMCPTYQDMSSSSSDDCLSSNSSDGIHPNAAGDPIYGYLMYKSGIPTRSRDWGNAAYPTMGHESWSWWVITGGSISGGSTDNVTGLNNGGSLSLPQSASAVSNVQAILPGSNTITITPTISQGTVIVSYRTSATNFARTSSDISWTTYTGGFTTTDNFIQIKLSNSEASTALISTASLDWSW